MKSLPLLLGFCLLGLSAMAQKDLGQSSLFTKQGPHQDLWIENWGEKDHLVKAQSLVPNWKLELFAQKSSRTAEHYHYQILKDGLPLDNYLLSVHHYRNGDLHLQYPQLPEHINPLTKLSLDTATLRREMGAERALYTRSFLLDDELIPGYAVDLYGDEGLHYHGFVADASIYYLEDQRRHVQTGQDSTCYAFIFLPDPLSTANVNYGGTFVDNNDGDHPSLNNERVLVSFKARYDSGTFRLESDDILIDDFSAPNVAPVTRNNTTFNFTRSQDAFEDVNAFYHLSTFKEYVNGLGFSNLPGYQIAVDVHALNNADQSYYSPSERRIYMGEGGVDDAEDADVIIHEYAHSLIFGASSNGNRISERAAMEEAICDYFAVSYSLSLSPNQRDRVFNWDGHNSFWPGRMASSTKDYQTLTFNASIYAHTDLMASCLLEIHDNTSREIADALVFEALFSLQNSTTYSQFAEMVIQADQNLNGGQHYQIIRDAFVRRNVLSADFSLQDWHNPQARVKLYNSFAFSQGKGPLRLSSERALKKGLIFDLSGKPVWSQEFDGKELTLDLAILKPGLYILSVEDERGQLSQFKIKKP